MEIDGSRVHFFKHPVVAGLMGDGGGRLAMKGCSKMEPRISRKKMLSIAIQIQMCSK